MIEIFILSGNSELAKHKLNKYSNGLAIEFNALHVNCASDVYFN